MTKQDELLDAMQDGDKLNLLYDLWSIVKHTPTRAAEILVQFKDVSMSIREMILNMQESISKFESIKSRLPEMNDALKMAHSFSKELFLIDDKGLNRLNRIIDVADKIKELKESGTLDLIKSLR